MSAGTMKSETHGILRGKHGNGSVKSLWNILQQVQGQDVRKSENSAASAGAVKSETWVDTEMSDRIFSGSQRGWFESWNAGETMLQGDKMQGSSGSIGFHYCVRCSLFSQISLLFDVSVVVCNVEGRKGVRYNPSNLSTSPVPTLPPASSMWSTTPLPIPLPSTPPLQRRTTPLQDRLLLEKCFPVNH